MKSLECLTKECITLLENNQVLKTLIKNQLGNEIISTLSQNEVFPEDHFKVGSTFYKFINFNLGDKA